MKWSEQPLVIYKFAKVVGSANISLKTNRRSQTNKKTGEFQTIFLRPCSLKHQRCNIQHAVQFTIKCACKGNLALQYYRLVPSVPFPRCYVLNLLTTLASAHNWSFVSWAKSQISFQPLFYHCYWHRAQIKWERDGAAENDPVAHTTYFMAIFLTPDVYFMKLSECTLGAFTIPQNSLPITTGWGTNYSTERRKGVRKRLGGCLLCILLLVMQSTFHKLSNTNI